MRVNTDEKIIDRLLKRGVENVIPSREGLKKRLMSGDILNVYVGIDPTSTKIHLGHAFVLRQISELAKLGHNVTFLIGDYTALIGDTSDKESERPVLTSEKIKGNLATYKEQVSALIDFASISVRFNSEWLSKLSFKDILDIARNFSVNDFISRELIRGRLDAGKSVSLPEMLYPIMQGYDSYILDTDIQVGGVDQTFNMQAGRTLNKRLRKKESFIITNGYLMGTDGAKMSKSIGNAIWLEDSADEIFGKVMSIADGVMESYFLLATNLSVEEIQQILTDNSDNPMELKKVLARQIITELRGVEQIQAAEENFVDKIQNKETTDETPIVELAQDSINVNQLPEILLEHDLVESKSEVRRLLVQGGLHVGEKSLNPDDKIELSSSTTIRIGKRRYLEIKKI